MSGTIKFSINVLKERERLSGCFRKVDILEYLLLLFFVCLFVVVLFVLLFLMLFWMCVCV